MSSEACPTNQQNCVLKIDRYYFSIFFSCYVTLGDRNKRPFGFSRAKDTLSLLGAFTAAGWWFSFCYVVPSCASDFFRWCCLLSLCSAICLVRADLILPIWGLLIASASVFVSLSALHNFSTLVQHPAWLVAFTETKISRISSYSSDWPQTQWTSCLRLFGTKTAGGHVPPWLTWTWSLSFEYFTFSYPFLHIFPSFLFLIFFYFLLFSLVCVVCMCVRVCVDALTNPGTCGGQFDIRTFLWSLLSICDRLALICYSRQSEWAITPTKQLFLFFALFLSSW